MTLVQYLSILEDLKYLLFMSKMLNTRLSMLSHTLYRIECIIDTYDMLYYYT